MCLIPVFAASVRALVTWVRTKTLISVHHFATVAASLSVSAMSAAATAISKSIRAFWTAGMSLAASMARRRSLTAQAAATCS